MRTLHVGPHLLSCDHTHFTQVLGLGMRLYGLHACMGDMHVWVTCMYGLHASMGDKYGRHAELAYVESN